MVSPSVPLLRVSAGENGVVAPTTVEFNASYADGAEARLRLVFDRGGWLRLTPSYSDTEVVREDDYDWSDTFPLIPGPDAAAALSRFSELWRATGRCPDPRAYEVHDSPWLAEVQAQGAGFGFRHYLILGHDRYVEVLATGWREERVT
jgi:hypothetical protein